MCGIAGMVSLIGQRFVDVRILERMAAQLVHRGPDDLSLCVGEDFGFIFRRLNIVGIQNGRQPLTNEDRSVTAVVNGEFFRHQSVRLLLESRGHQFRTNSDSEILVHLWEEQKEAAFANLRGQFALALHDAKAKLLVLARDRVGICPLYYCQAGDWLLFASEIKALLAAGMIERQVDLAGLDQVFTFFCMPGARTAFEGIRSVMPGKYIQVNLAGGTNAPSGAQMREKEYWDFEFPDASDAAETYDESEAIDGLSAVFSRAVEERFAAEVPVACLLSGGVDSALIAQAQSGNGNPPRHVFTAQIIGKRFDESTRASEMAARLNAPQHIVRFSPESVASFLPSIIHAADAPVADLTAGCHLALCREISRHGFKVVISGEGADEAFGGYSWFKAHQLFHASKWIHGSTRWAMRNVYQNVFRRSPRGEFDRIEAMLGGMHAQNYLYMMTSRVRWLLVRPEILDAIGSETAYDQLQLNTENMKRWHPFNRSLYFTYKTHLSGLLLSQRGDRTAMASSVEVRYPFLDEDVIEFCSDLPVHWKLRGLFRDKYLLRKLAARVLPAEIAMRRKAMFVADFGNSLLGGNHSFVDQLLSIESLNKTGYFDVGSVHKMVARLRRGYYPPLIRSVVELSLSAVVATQLWSHQYFGGDLCELPSWTPSEAQRVEPA